MNSYKTGLFFEWITRLFLMMHGFRIISKRYVTGKNTNRAEIDIIAKRGKLIIFVEVKHRKTLHATWGAISNTQIRRLRLAAETFLIQKKWSGDARFDVIFVRGFHIDWIKNAF